MRRLLRPGWVLTHLALVGGLWLCTILASWQWGRGGSTTGSARNYLYSVQWVVFGLMGVYGWARAVQDVVRPTGPSTKPGRAPVRRADYTEPVIDDSDDPELAAYNAMLARLNQR